MNSVIRAVVWWFFGFCIFMSGAVFGYREALKDAYHKGHAVQCVGKSGYHWDCD